MATYETTVTRETDAQQGGGSSAFTAITDELLAGVVDGINKVFTTANTIASIRLFKNMGALHIGDDFTITGANQITFVTAPATGSRLIADYYTSDATENVAWQTVADADTVDGIHASTTPQANKLLPLDSAAKVPYNALGLTAGMPLVIAENTEQLSFNGTTKTRWLSGTWTQYGAMATTANPAFIKIVVPAGKTYTIKLNHLCSAVSSPSGNWGQSGIAKLNSDMSAMVTILSSSMNANGDNYHPQTSECVQVLTAGTHNFCVWVRTNVTTSNNIWYGGGDSADMATSYVLGRSCVFTATLVTVV